MAKTPTAIGALLPKVLRKAGDTHLAIQALRRAWTRVVGKELAAHTKPARLRAGRLYIYTDAPGASFILSLETPRLLERMQACLEKARPKAARRQRRPAAGPFVVEEIIVRAGDV